MRTAGVIWPSLIVPCDQAAAQRAGLFRKSSGGDKSGVRVGSSKEMIAEALRGMTDSLRKAEGEARQAQVIFLSTCGEDVGALQDLENVIDVAAETFPWPLRRHHVFSPAPGRSAAPADVPLIAAGAWFVGPPSAKDAEALDASVKEPLQALLTLLCLTDWRDRLHDPAVREFFVPRLPFPDEPLIRLVGVPKPSPFSARRELCVALVGEAVRRAAQDDEAREVAGRTAAQILADAGLRKRLTEGLAEQAATQPLGVALGLCANLLAKLDERSDADDDAAEAAGGPPAPDDDARMSWTQRRIAHRARSRGLVCYLPRQDAPRRHSAPVLAPEQRQLLEARARLPETLSEQIADHTPLPGAPPEIIDAAERRTRDALASALSRRPAASPAVDAESILQAAARQMLEEAASVLWDAGADWGASIESCAALVAALESGGCGPFGKRSITPRLAAATAGFGGSIPGAGGRRLPLAEVSTPPGGGDAFLLVSDFLPARIAFD